MAKEKVPSLWAVARLSLLTLVLTWSLLQVPRMMERLPLGAGSSFELLLAACLFVLFSRLGRWHFFAVIHSRHMRLSGLTF